MVEKLLAQEQQRVALFEEKLGYNFRHRIYLLEALVHRSFAFEQGRRQVKDNEILEFLGDAVLDLVLSHALSERFPAMREGELSKLRAALVNEAHLAKMARELGLGDFLLLGKGEDISCGREKPSILSSAYEAVVGALFKDGGYDLCARFVQQQFAPWYTRQLEAVQRLDAKSHLQEICQQYCNATPNYEVEGAEGPDHAKLFTVAVYFQGRKLATAAAKSKKEAEQLAAAAAIENMGDLGFGRPGDQGHGG